MKTLGITSCVLLFLILNISSYFILGVSQTYYNNFMKYECSSEECEGLCVENIQYGLGSYIKVKTTCFQQNDFETNFVDIYTNEPFKYIIGNVYNVYTCDNKFYFDKQYYYGDLYYVLNFFVEVCLSVVGLFIFIIEIFCICEDYFYQCSKTFKKAIKKLLPCFSKTIRCSIVFLSILLMCVILYTPISNLYTFATTEDCPNVNGQGLVTAKEYLFDHCYIDVNYTYFFMNNVKDNSTKIYTENCFDYDIGKIYKIYSGCKFSNLFDLKTFKTLYLEPQYYQYTLLCASLIYLYKFFVFVIFESCIVYLTMILFEYCEEHCL